MPLAVIVDGANRHDMKLAAGTLADVVLPSAPDPSEVEQHLCLDRGYDYPEIRHLCECWGYTLHLHTRGEERRAKQDIPGYRARRWVVGRTHSWFNRFRRLLIRWEKKVENYLAMLHFACAWITFRTSGLFG